MKARNARKGRKERDMALVANVTDAVLIGGAIRANNTDHDM